MKDINYYKGLHYKMLLEYDDSDGVHYARFPELPGCMADGKTEQEALDTALKVKDEWLVATYEAGWKIPEPSVREETSGRVTLRMPKYLHRRVIDRADEEGVSQNQLILAFIAQGLDRSSIENAFKKIATTQDEIIRLLE